MIPWVLGGVKKWQMLRIIRGKYCKSRKSADFISEGRKSENFIPYSRDDDYLRLSPHSSYIQLKNAGFAARSLGVESLDTARNSFFQIPLSGAFLHGKGIAFAPHGTDQARVP
jgi:hypothetical protein